MGKREKLCLVLLTVLLSFVLAAGLALRYFEGHMDTVLPGRIMEDIVRRGGLVFQDTGLHQIFDIVAMPAERVCQLSFKAPANDYENVWHTYWILYLFAPLTFLIPGRILFSLLTGISFAGMLGLAYTLVRKRGASVVESLLFVLLISSHPAWSYSLFGQLYVDRLFLGAGFLFLFFIELRPERPLTLLVSGLAAALINDRLGLICGAFVTGYSILYWREIKVLRWRGLLIGAVLGLFSVLLMNVIQNQFYGGFGSQFSPAGIVANFSDIAFREKLYVFLLVNFVFFGFLALIDWKAALLVLGVMVPNIVGNIGGAEKVNWLTHYHSTYFPVLIWAAAAGFIKLRTKVNSLPARFALAGWMLAACALSIGVYPFSFASLKFSPSNFSNNGIYRSFRELPHYLSADYQSRYRLFGEELRKAVPEPARITVPEGIMPLLFFGDRRIYYYPVGLEDADYAILGYQPEESGNLRFSGFSTYLGADEARKIDECMQQKLADAGYDFSGAKLFQNGWAVIPRTKKSSSEASAF